MTRGEMKALMPPVARTQGRRWPFWKAIITLPRGTVHMPMGRAMRKKRAAKRMRLVVGGEGLDTGSKRERRRAKINLQKWK
jgi:hypothetical protein